MPLRKSTMIDPLISLREKQISHLYSSRKKHQQFAVIGALIEKGQYSRALNLLRIIRVPSENRQDFHCLMGRCYKALGHFTQAFEQFQAALQIDLDCQDAREAIKYIPKPQLLQQVKSFSQVGTMSKVLKWLNSDVRF
jgi:tetratricopeptide (TPR) repeat protein